MPSERLLCLEFDVSRATICHALDLLEEEGLIEHRQGVPTSAKPLEALLCDLFHHQSGSVMFAAMKQVVPPLLC
ncbi:MAG: GntR family transcriptional regulator [Gammaproteobacteria bacterium]|nr:GntR family transcriptional regulator [Gammaproteobacteria bacterium]MCP4088955.1 GntR family transcriptional regulator [Gammaproteobacteria bacterium]MCP4831961.1 GntR family transcriptional regulator [Gammaproteobacteria bacterium]MCP4927567.1 GntR family transcriptional regulator [Gammaproteobacteria bacterium]